MGFWSAIKKIGNNRIVRKLLRRTEEAVLDAADEGVDELAEAGAKKTGAIGKAGIKIAQKTAHDLANDERERLRKAESDVQQGNH